MIITANIRNAFWRDLDHELQTSVGKRIVYVFAIECHTLDHLDAGFVFQDSNLRRNCFSVFEILHRSATFARDSQGPILVQRSAMVVSLAALSAGAISGSLPLVTKMHLSFALVLQHHVAQ